MAWLVFFAAAMLLLALGAAHHPWRRGGHGQLAVGTIFGCLVGAVFLYFHPPGAFYRSEFERLARVPFPASGKIIFADTSASVYSVYRSCAVFRVSAEDYRALKRIIVARQGEPPLTGSDHCSNWVSKENGRALNVVAQFDHAEPGHYLKWGLLDDGASVIYTTFSWKDLNPV